EDVRVVDSRADAVHKRVEVLDFVERRNGDPDLSYAASTLRPSIVRSARGTVRACGLRLACHAYPATRGMRATANKTGVSGCTSSRREKCDASIPDPMPELPRPSTL